MAVAAAIYIIAGAATFYVQIGGYATIPLRARPDEVQYFAGKPSSVQVGRMDSEPSAERAGDREWLYLSQDLERTVRFENGRVVRISCSGQNCPRALGVRLGQDESSVLAALGTPADEFVTRGRKVMRYTDVGYDFVLENSLVKQIVVVDRQPSSIKILGRFLIWLLP